jgi:uncharacterized protein YgiM (DUF1202 family)
MRGKNIEQYREPETITMKKLCYLSILILSLLFSGCVEIHIQSVQPLAPGVEVVLTTLTPLSDSGANPTASGPVEASPTATSTATATPTATLTPSPTGTPTLVSSATVTATMAVNARCHSGPGIDYAVTDWLNQGEQVLLVGRDADGGWLLVQRQAPREVCWTSLVTVDTTALQTDGLPQMTPPPPPTRTPVPTSAPTSERSKSKPPSGSTAAPTTAVPYPAPPTKTPNPYP